MWPWRKSRSESGARSTDRITGLIVGGLTDKPVLNEDAMRMHVLGHYFKVGEDGGKSAGD